MLSKMTYYKVLRQKVVVKLREMIRRLLQYSFSICQYFVLQVFGGFTDVLRRQKSQMLNSL